MAGKTLHTLRAGHMHDERVVGRAAFGFKDFGDSCIVASVSGQAIHSFRRQTQQLTALQSLRSSGDG
jgi:hypothetical protein